MTTEEELVYLLTMLALIITLRMRRANRAIVHDSVHKGHDFVHDCILGHRRNCFELLRMEQETYIALCNTLRIRGLLHDARDVTVEEQVAIFLLTVGHNERNRAVQYVFQHSGQTISKYFNLVLQAICSIGNHYIGRRSDDTPAKIRGESRFYPYFKDCLGAINGTHIPAHVPVNAQKRYQNRKGWFSQNVLAVVGFDMRFHYVLAGWEGSATDSRVLYSALDDPDLPLLIPEGKYYLADVGYPNIVGFITPHQNNHYHLSDFNAPDAKPIDKPEELYNHRHSSLRTTVELVFGLLKARFPILKCPVQYPIPTQVKIVHATCILHNFIIENNPNAERFTPDIDNHIIRQPDPEEENARQLVTRGNNNDVRNAITAQMWNDWQQRRGDDALM